MSKHSHISSCGCHDSGAMGLSITSYPSEVAQAILNIGAKLPKKTTPETQQTRPPSVPKSGYLFWAGNRGTKNVTLTVGVAIFVPRFRAQNRYPFLGTDSWRGGGALRRLVAKPSSEITPIGMGLGAATLMGHW